MNPKYIQLDITKLTKSGLEDKQLIDLMEDYLKRERERIDRIVKIENRKRKIKSILDEKDDQYESKTKS